MAGFITLHSSYDGAEIDLNVDQIVHFSMDASAKGSYIQTSHTNYGVKESPEEIRSLLASKETLTR